MSNLKNLLLNRSVMIEPSRLDYIVSSLDVEKGAMCSGEVHEIRNFSVIEGIAIIPVIGLLMHRPFYSHYMMIESYQNLAQMIMTAAMDSSIKAILLDIDSGGGEVEGVFSLAELIKEVSEESKPVYGIANGAAFSAAYAIGVSCEQLFVTKTGGVGSIGVVAEHVDISKMNEAMGVKITPIFAGDKKVERSPDFPISDGAVARIQKEVNDSYELFLNHVDAMNPMLSAEDARATQAGLFFGQDAVESNLANEVLDFDGAINFILETLEDSGLNQNNAMMQTGETEQMKKLLKAKEHKTELKAEADEVKTEDVKLEAEAPEVKDEAKTEDVKLEAENKDEVKAESEADEVKAEDEDGEKVEVKAEAPKTESLDKAAIIEQHSKIMHLAIDAGHAAMAPSLIERGISLEDAEKELDKAATIKGFCKRAGREEMADELIKQGLSVEDSKAKLFDAMVDQADETAVSNKPSASAIDNDALKGYTNQESSVNPLVANAEKRANS